jgi:hypothetical protein
MNKTLSILLTMVLLGVVGPGVWAADQDYVLSIKDHHFDPVEVRVPAGEKLRLLIRNLDATPEEFESYDLNREKVVLGGKEATVFIGPLQPGRYEVFGEFHSDTARGYIVAE